ncbi:MAG TPA: hypothetical protein VGN31_15035 [Paraburkholderia sp.]
MTTSATSPAVAAGPIAGDDPARHQAFDTAPRREPDATRSGAARRHPRKPHNRHHPPPSLPSAEQVAARGVPPDPATTPTIVSNPLQAPPDSRHASEAELTSLLARYDDKHANAAGDTINAELSARLEDVAMAGYPDDARRFERDVQRDLGMLAQLPADLASTYRDQMKATWDAFESTPDAWLRQKAQHDAKTLHNQIAQEYEEARTDPRQRAQAIFNAPFGSDLPGGGAQQDLDTLRDLGRQFRLASTKADREAIFASASKIRQSLQDTIFDSTPAQIDAQTRAEAGNEKDVMQELERAQSSSGPGATTGARLASFANRVFGDTAHTLAFTELVNLTPERLQSIKATDPERFAHLTALRPERLQEQLIRWENEFAEQDKAAARRLPEVPLEPPKNIWDVHLNLPAPGSQYADDLRQRYVDVLHSITAAENRISISHERPSSPIRQTYIKTHQPAQ